MAAKPCVYISLSLCKRVISRLSRIYTFSASRPANTKTDVRMEVRLPRARTFGLFNSCSSQIGGFCIRTFQLQKFAGLPVGIKKQNTIFSKAPLKGKVVPVLH